MDCEGLGLGLGLGHRDCSKAAAVLGCLLSKRAKLDEDLRNIEKQVFEMETNYLQDPSQCGNVLKGYEGFLSISKTTTMLKRSRKFQPEDRLFSLSSITSPPAEDQALVREDGRLDSGVGRYRGIDSLGNGQGKPKKGRGAREGKRMKHADQDFDYEDDTDM